MSFVKENIDRFVTNNIQPNIERMKRIKDLSARRLVTQIVSLVLIISILTMSTPAAPSLVLASFTEFGQDVRYAYLTSDLRNSLSSFSWESLAENPVVGFFLKGRKQNIARIDVSPNQALLNEGEKLAFTAAAVDGRGNPVQGTAFKWTAVNVGAGKKGALIRMNDGVFNADVSGIFEVRAEAFGQVGTVRIRVLKDSRMLATQDATDLAKTGGKDRKNGKLRDDVAREEAQIKPLVVKNSSRMSLEQAKQMMKTENDYRKESPLKKQLDPNQKIPQIKKARQIEKNNGKVAENDLSENKRSGMGGPDAREPNLAEESAVTGGVGGYLNTLNGTWISGCATGGYGVMVEFYVDGGPYGGGSYAGDVFAGAGGCNFDFQIPNTYWDDQSHSISAYVYSMDDYTYYELNGSPQIFQLTSNGTTGGGASSGTSSNWGNPNFPTAGNPGEQPGTPAGDGTAGAGSGNFGFAAPAVGLGGRGMGVNLSLSYNSLLWHKAGTEMSYDIDKGSPAPGWNIGFGKMMDMGTNGGAMLEDLDGTRHSYEGTIQYTYGGYSGYAGKTTDGSFVDYRVYRAPSGLTSGIAYMANGTIVNYGAAADGILYPTQIKDRNGNYISIAYQNNQGPNMTNVTDNLGRVVTFNYDSGNRLVSISGPGQNGTTATLVRIHYVQKTLGYAFSGLTTQVRDNSPYQIDAIYYPTTNTGYWFGDADSYSSYGMIAKVKEMRGMSWTGSSNNDQGTIAPGLMTRQMVYNYDMTPNTALTGAPLYTQLTEDWEGRDDGTTPVAMTQYNIVNNPPTGTPRTTTITAPNGNRVVQYSYNDPNNALFGMLYKIESLAPAPSNQVFGKTETEWENGDYNTVRVKSVTSTDEKQQTTKQAFTYEQFNQMLTATDYGYQSDGFPLLRKTVNSYENGAPYVGYFNNGMWSGGRHIFSLPKSSEILDANNTRLSRNETSYDQYPLTDTPGVVMYDQTYNPFTTQLVDGSGCFNWDSYWVSYGDPYEPNSGYYEYVCTQYEQVPNFDQSTAARGNATQTKTYADAVSLSGAILYDSTYDITGNTRTTTTNCCQQMSFGYTVATQYSQPETHTKGSADPNSPDRMTESATYDFNTGLLTTAHDFNNLQTTYVYDAANRPIQTIGATGAKSITEYDNANLKVTQTATDAANVIIGKSISFANGRGQSVMSQSLAGTSWTASTVKYDNLGRKTQASMPYDLNAGASQWTTFTYDQMSRVTQVTAPDGSTSQTFYNEATKPSSAASNNGQTVRSRDAWGRERWARSDAFGRLVEVVEPNPNGNGSVFDAGNMVTNYQYDAVDQLLQVNQGAQVRAFKYDSLGRLTRQKLAEQAATIEGVWSDAFQYDNRSNLVQRTDARGVKTNFNYQTGGNPDPLNRLLSISYDKSTAINPTTIADAAAVMMGYKTGGDKTRVETVKTGNPNAPETLETNVYDSFSRVSEYSMAMSGKPALTMNYLYDSANRLTKVIYPNQYGTNNPGFRKEVEPGYDNASRLTQLTVSGQIQMSEIVYNPMSQVTQLKTGASTNNADIEQYSYDAQTGLLTNQKVIKQNNSQTLLDLSYNYNRGNSNGSLNGKTGQLTQITDNLNANKNRSYEFDTLGRLRLAKGGATGVAANWTQSYTFDRYGNRTNVQASGVTQNNQPVPTDGLPNMSYDQTSNRITNTNYEFDQAGNQTRGQAPNGQFQRFDFDAAGRLVKIKDDSGNIIESYTYGASRQRLKTVNGAVSTYYAWGGSSVLCEYTETTGNSASFKFTKSYIYAGSRLLSTQTLNGTAEITEFHHPDRLGTKLVTNDTANTSYEQSTLPFGTALNAESTGFSNQVFTSYERSAGTGLDYAQNRSYSSGQGRFTSVDPIGMSSGSITDPQSNNLFAYTQNNPIDFTDPSGLNEEAPLEPGIIRVYTKEPYDWGWAWFTSGAGSFDWLYDGPNVSGGTDGSGGTVNGGETENLNCIANTLQRGVVTTRGINEAIAWSPTAAEGVIHTGKPAHDGIHLTTSDNKTSSVTAVGAMSGKILHSGRQSSGDTLGLVDILLDSKINGQQYVMTLKDMDYSTLKKTGVISTGTKIGDVSDVTSEDGIGVTLHVALMPYSEYKAKIDGKWSGKARDNVAIGALMDAARNRNSPFKCNNAPAVKKDIGSVNPY